MICNDSCCSYGDGHVMCFGDYNFTDRSNLTFTEPWELGIRWIYTILVTLVAFFGNLTIIIVLTNNRLLLRTSVNVFILNMSCADLILSCTGPVPFTIKDTHQFFVLGEAWCHLEGSLQIMVMMVSVTSLAVISFDRMMGIVRPFHDHLKQWQSLGIIIIIWLVAALFAVPFGMFRHYNVRIWKDVTEMTCGEDNSDLRIWWIVVVVALTWLPQCVMLICYTTIIFYIYGSRNSVFTREHPAIIHLKKRVIWMMFVVVVGFTICWSPFELLKMLSYLFVDEDGKYINDRLEKQYSILLTVSQYMIYTNSAFNPIVYALMHLTYRRAFRITFSFLFNRKSPFVLTRGVGPRSYVWSLKSSAQCVYGEHMVEKSRSSKLVDMIKRNKQVTSSAVVSSSATVAAIILEPSKRIANDKPNRCGGGNDGNNTGNETSLHPLTSNVKEGYVPDITPNRATGALGHLITQVIEEEETSSDCGNERIL